MNRKLSLLAALFVSALVFTGGSPVNAHADTKPGSPAPDFTLEGIDGKKHSLSDFRGKVVVLEWFNHECPFVKKHYNSNNMQQLQSKYTGKGVIWLSINSSAEGKQGYLSAKEAKLLTEEKKASPTTVLLDPKGEAGRAYGAMTTPHMFVIDKDGKVVYAGAIDDNESPKPADALTAKNYVAQAVDEVLAGKSVSTAQTDPYGCSVKYAA